MDEKAQARKDRARFLQKKRRSEDTGTRKAMLAWAKSDAGKAAARKYRKTTGKATRLANGFYQRKDERLRSTIAGKVNHRRRWSKNDDLMLLRLVADGKPASEICVLMSRSHRGIERRRERLRRAQPLDT